MPLQLQLLYQDVYKSKSSEIQDGGFKMAAED